jgi:DNA-binding winged helix-turn-helix (wHTH) protein/tetratricopeptide (TPR) repeat protein
LLKEAPVRFEGFELDPAARSLKRDGKLLALTPKTLDLLLYLASHPNQLVSKDELLSAVWPNAYVEESNLSQHVFLLRKVLNSAGSSERIVVTVPGKGYQFAAMLEAAPRPLPESGPDWRTGNAGQHEAGALLLHAVRSVTSVVVEEETDDELPVALPGRSIRFGRTALVAAAAALVLAGVGSALAWRWLRPAPAGHIDMVVGQIENTTRDGAFDQALDQALAIDLEQSPYLNLISRPAIQQTLTEMRRSPEETLTPSLAREICERNNAQIVLGGTLSRLGSRYLLMLHADSCVNGKEVAGVKAQAGSKEAVLGALDSAAGQLRRQLGESTASLDKFQIPVAQATTSSLDALRAYTLAGESFERGDMKAAQGSYEKAIALDPKFASAYESLGSTFYERCDNAQAAAYFTKAYTLRDRGTERERLAIEISYFGYGLNDYEEAIRRTRQFLDTFPNDSGGWSWTNLANLYVQLGQYAQAIDAGEHALRVDPHSAPAAQVLARAYKQAGRFADAKRVADASIAEGKDNWLTHSILFHIAYAEGDAARIKSDGDWGLTHLNANMTLDDLGLAAATSGKLREAREDFARSRAESLRIGDREYADGVLLDEASVLAEFGELKEAAALLKQIKVDVGDPGDVVYYEALAGDSGPAQRFVAPNPATERDTVKVFIDQPLVRALLALEARKPTDAVQALELARPYQLRDYRVPYLRAQAETEAGMLDAAVADYRLILSNRGVDPIEPVYSLAHLKLARVLMKQLQIEEAKGEYEAFFNAWKDADADLPLLVAAKREFATLGG